jgi:acetylcholinesterase
MPKWPQYRNKSTNFVFRADKSYVEDDCDRREGVTFINTLVR